MVVHILKPIYASNELSSWLYRPPCAARCLRSARKKSAKVAKVGKESRS
jgi:hypothetical protein